LFLGEALFHQIRQIDFNRLRREFSLVLLTRHVAPDSFDLILIPGGAETRRQRRGVVENYRLSLLAWLASRWRLRFLCDRRRRQGVAPKLDPHQAIGAGFRYVVWRWATTLGGGASSPVAKEGPLSSAASFIFLNNRSRALQKEKPQPGRTGWRPEVSAVTAAADTVQLNARPRRSSVF
jgi:hypothetical protein